MAVTGCKPSLSNCWAALLNGVAPARCGIGPVWHAFPSTVALVGGSARHYAGDAAGQPRLSRQSYIIATLWPPGWKLLSHMHYMPSWQATMLVAAAARHAVPLIATATVVAESGRNVLYCLLGLECIYQTQPVARCHQCW